MSVATKKKKIFDGRYEVLSIVGRGACSVVYHAKNITSPSSEVALKVLINQQGGTSSTDRLRKEALAMVSSRHKYVIRLDDFHSVQDLCYLSMEYAREGDLRKYSSKLGGKLPLDQAINFFKQSAEALNFVHRVGITHRDIKPDNILVLNDKEIRLTDFGVAVLPGEQASLDDLQQGVGTMSYMAPEVLEGKACDKLSDIYALGVSFYEMLSGVHPFENAPLIKQLEVREDNSVKHISRLVPNIPKKIADIIMRCMRYQPDQRFLTMNDLLKALNDNSEQQKPAAPAAKQPSAKTAIPAPKKEQPMQPAKKENIEQKKQRIATKPKLKTKPDTAGTEKNIAPQPPSSSSALDKSLEDEIDEILNELEDADNNTPQAQPANPEDKHVKPDHNKIENDILDENQEPELVDDDDLDLHEEEDADSGYLSDPRSSKAAIKDKPAYQTSYKSNSEAAKPSFLNTLLVAALILYVGNYLLYKITGYKIFGSSEEYTVIDGDDSSSLIVKASEPIEAFPNLPAGMYQGSIYDIIPGEESKLAVISLPEQNSLIFIIGVEGWTPSMSAITAPKNNAKSNSIRVSSNGIVLDMEAELTDGALSGVYRNALNGTVGKWQLKSFNK